MSDNIERIYPDKDLYVKIDSLSSVWQALYFNIVEKNFSRMITQYSKIYLDAEMKAHGNKEVLCDLLEKKNQELCERMFEKDFIIIDLDKFKQSIYEDALYFIEESARSTTFKMINNLVDDTINKYQERNNLKDIDLNLIKNLCEVQETYCENNCNTWSLIGFKSDNSQFIINPFKKENGKEECNPFEYYGKDKASKFVQNMEVEFNKKQDLFKAAVKEGVIKNNDVEINKPNVNPIINRKIHRR